MNPAVKDPGHPPTRFAKSTLIGGTKPYDLNNISDKSEGSRADVIIDTLADAESALPKDAAALNASISALKSCISTLESSIKALEDSSSGWETLAWACAIGVGIGIIGEIVVIVREYRDDDTAWRRGIVRPPDRPSLAMFWFDIIATVLVLFGVLGEAGASMKLASINSQLRSKTSELRAKSDQLLAVVTQEAGSAASSAHNASMDAANAKDSAGEAQAKANAAVTTANTLLHAVGDRFVLNPAAFGAHVAERFGPSREMLKATHGSAIKKSITVQSYRGDPEGYRLCMELTRIVDSATNAGTYRVCGGIDPPIAESPIIGIRVSGSDESDVTYLAGLLESKSGAGLPSVSIGASAPGLAIFVGRQEGIPSKPRR